MESVSSHNGKIFIKLLAILQTKNSLFKGGGLPRLDCIGNVQQRVVVISYGHLQYDMINKQGIIKKQNKTIPMAEESIKARTRKNGGENNCKNSTFYKIKVAKRKMAHCLLELKNLVVGVGRLTV